MIRATLWLKRDILFENSKKKIIILVLLVLLVCLQKASDSRKYWSVLKTRLKKEGSELTTKCSQLKMKSLKES